MTQDCPGCKTVVARLLKEGVELTKVKLINGHVEGCATLAKAAPAPAAPFGRARGYQPTAVPTGSRVSCHVCVRVKKCCGHTWDARAGAAQPWAADSYSISKPPSFGGPEVAPSPVETVAMPEWPTIVPMPLRPEFQPKRAQLQPGLPPRPVRGQQKQVWVGPHKVTAKLSDSGYMVLFLVLLILVCFVGPVLLGMMIA